MTCCLPVCLWALGGWQAGLAGFAILTHQIQDPASRKAQICKLKAIAAVQHLGLPSHVLNHGLDQLVIRTCRL